MVNIVNMAKVQTVYSLKVMVSETCVCNPCSVQLLQLQLHMSLAHPPEHCEFISNTVSYFILYLFKYGLQHNHV